MLCNAPTHMTHVTHVVTHVHTGTPEVIVAIVDTGADLDHPDLRPSLWVNKREIPGNGIDDDGNGELLFSLNSILLANVTSHCGTPYPGIGGEAEPQKRWVPFAVQVCWCRWRSQS